MNAQPPVKPGEPNDLRFCVLATLHAQGLVNALLLDAHQQPLGVLNATDKRRVPMAAGSDEQALLRNCVIGVVYQ